ncbi:protein WVD2-like 7 isoform X2 [Andrographis paniculata]|nr:protein WVD2-like 7 isoform X2 [Andrographis paniculata]
MLALGDSVSFGRFLNESLSWEKRSAFLHRNYVEEAERYSRPGSVAQKKAFFEARYKRIAAKKAAADVLEQSSPITESVEVESAAENQRDPRAWEMVRVDIPKGNEALETVEDKDNGDGQSGHDLENHQEIERVSVKLDNDIEEQDAVSVSASERSMLKADYAASEDKPLATSKDGLGAHLSSSSDASIQHKTWKGPSEPAQQVFHLEKQSNAVEETITSRVNSMDVKLSPSKLPENSGDAGGSSMAAPLSKNLSSKPSVKESDRDSNSEKAYSSTAQSNSASTNPPANSQLNSTRAETAVVSSTLGSKSTSHKWRYFSAMLSNSLTEKSATKSKQKPEENLTGSEAQKTKLQESSKDKAGNKIKKLGCMFCFKDSNPLDEEEQYRNQGTISMPSSSPKSLSKNSSEKNGIRVPKLFTERS